MSGDQPSDRRGFLLDSFKSLGRLCAEAVSQTITSTTGGKRYLRPPGAIDEAAFLLTCTRCGECAKVCPTHTIKFLGPNAGAAVGTPYIDPYDKACDLCGKCMPACEPRALLNIADPRLVRMGTAVIDPEHCWAHKGQICDICYQRCPFPDEAMTFTQGKPVVVPDLCTGCGLCAYVCVSTPAAIRIEPRS